MAKSVRALVAGSMLEWTRRTAKMTLADAAARIKVDEAVLRSWENAERPEDEPKPTIRQLRELAHLYRRPLAVFYLHEIPTHFEPLRDFRRPDPEDPRVTTELEFAIRDAAARRELAADLATRLGVEPPRFTVKATIDDDAEKVAKRIRAALDVSIAMQLAWRTDGEALKGWRVAIEACGVLVFRMSEVEWEVARGFSIAADVYPAVVASVQDEPAPRIFTLLHELAHLALHNGGIGVCNMREDGKGEGPSVEAFCNRVAGAVAVPGDALLADAEVAQHGPGDWTEAEIAAVAARFHVSVEVLARRLLIVGWVTASFYKALRERWAKRYHGKQRPPPEEKRSGFEPPSQRAFREAGPTFVRLVLSAYGENRLTASEVADAFGVRLKHLPAIEHELHGAA